MIPRGSEGIANLATRVGLHLIPSAPDAYTAADLGMMTMLLGLVAQDYDRAADVLVGERAALEPLFRKAATRLPTLAARIGEALGAEAPSLKVHDLTARSDIDLKLLIDIQAAVEGATGADAEWATALDAEIWGFLEAHVAARAYEAAF